MPYGISAQSVLGAGGSRAAAPREDGSTANSQLPGARKQKQNHFGGEARATSTTSTFAGAMRALLKPTPTPAAAPAAAAAAPTTRGAERVVWQPRSALDASGHSFSKTLKAEISRSKQQRNDPLANGNGSNNGWWDGGRLGGGGLDDSMVHAPPPQSRSNPRGTPRVPMATGRRAGAPGGIAHHQHHHQPQQPQQRQQQQQQQQQQHMSVSMRRPKSYRDQCLDEISRAVGLQ